MTLYSVFDRRQNEAPEVVPDRFSWFAALLPPVYAALHRLWLALIGWVLLMIGVGLIGTFFGAELGFWVYVLLAILIGFEAPALRRLGLRRRGYLYRSELIAAAPDLAQVIWMKRRAGR
ncbi:MAG TPA: DUF2628 domain-containing protein [Devosia sp.]|nr:DUF2628 domain-containing protein [Devosia sp.]